MNLPLLLAAALAASPAGASPAAPPSELPLPDALAELDRQSPSLAQSRARADEASSLVRQAAAPLLPGLTATGSATRNSDEARINIGKLLTLPPGVAAPPPVTIQPLHSVSGAVTLRVPLLVPSAWFDLEAARGGARSAAAQAEASRRALRASLAATAFLGAAAEEAVTATEQAVRNAAALAESADRKVKAGTAAPLDALRARTEQVKREGDLVRARADLDKVRLALGALLGRETPVRVTVPDEAPAAAPAGEEALVAEALDHRPELAAAAAQVEGAEAQVRSAWARLAPQLSASGSAFAADVPYPTGAKDGWRATLDLTWPLYDGGLRYGKRREAEARVAGARAGAEAQRIAVGQEVRDAARDVAVAAERLRLAGEQRRLAAEAAGTAQRTYEAGVASSLDVVDADDRLYAADIGLADARARLASARVALDRALGRGP
ncbi:MAG TPA: TolC family protein [Anaeromyxobacteraceae bacterium]|nr:TolC family protein [Anaeromyxobacteraceae bacterium]